MKDHIEKWCVAGQIPVISPATCTRCGKCLLVCPGQAIRKVPNPVCSKCMGYCMTMPVSCFRENIAISYTLCDGCGNCVDYCPQGAISWFKISDVF